MTKLKKLKKSKTETKGSNETRVVIGPCRSTYMFLNELTPPRKKDGTIKDGAKACKTGILIKKKDK